MKSYKNGVNSHTNSNSHHEPKSVFTWDECLPIPRLSFIPAATIVFILATACFLNSISGHFVFDDFEAILNNNDLTPNEPIGNLFFHDFWGNKLNSDSSHKSYRPFAVLTFRLNYFLAGGLHPWGFHIVNVILHGIVSILFLKVFSCVFGACSTSTLGGFPAAKSSLLCAVIFAIHPIHTENVAGVVGRADLLCALLVTLSILSYIKACNTDKNCLTEIPANFSWLWFTGSIIFMASSMLCKEQGITVIGICSAYDIIIVCRIDPLHFISLIKNQKIPNKVPCWGKSLLIRHLILMVSGILLLALRWKLMGFKPPTFQIVDNPHSFVSSFYLRSINYSYLYALNVWLLLNPWWLCFDWSMGCIPTIESFLDPRCVLVLLFWVGFCTFLHVSVTCSPGHQKRLLLLSIAFLLIPFLPASNLFFRVGFVIAERILYLPSVGYCMLFVIGLQQFCQYSVFSKKVVTSLLIFLVVINIYRSVQRSSEWQTEFQLFTSGAKVCPLNAKIHYNIGKVLGDSGQVQMAIDKYYEAIRLYPEYDQAMNNLANILKDQGQEEAAEKLLTKAIQIRPSFSTAWMNLGIVKASQKKYEEALYSYRTAIQHRRNYPDCYYNMGNCFLETKQYQLALLAWQNATLLKSTHLSSWSNMVILLDNMGNLTAAETMCNMALRHLPGESILYLHLASILGKLGRYKESERNFLTAIKLKPDTARYYLNLGILYHRWGKYDKAEAAYEKTLLLNPSLKNAQEYLQAVQKKLKQGS
ncbi:protein O-mannosyl-transferase TMTC4 [Octopus bimaculoides]|uniref:dolichyl-phosphate-mannose--protein mannosyltransferase n=1 Tax=Octopus bimaculoides TaxID=37653 RepID=A0A0L8I9F3_OCTBM|nr:protein O-mannosyl-transferase TMTC4 [Octopus bimaculoides]XP_014787361.1 protein O-mannosyl-transferase TMTC4 [Octopus bimaculoides]XP_052822886.1 protein O-mannosyl-transferase TMTC4 [Octopus bimaculoides]XP_052822887.1 protein O-mannosyl-transferase TMTC4 [Octopus bimaculoides]|eukprot:XP_014787352.1 PREDICTED: transmembrane and TPR repeat-containing protein 4-like [Octopus bimaculoides]